VLNATELAFDQVPLHMFTGAAPQPGGAPVLHVLPRLRGGSETIVDVVRDGSGQPIPGADGRPQRIFRPTLPAGAPQAVAFLLDPDHRIRECDKQDNFTGFLTYPLDPTDPAVPVAGWPVPPQPLPAPPAPCASQGRPGLRLVKLVNGQPHIKVASHTPVQVTHVVTNTGTTPLQGVRVVDLLLNQTFGPITLAPGQSHVGFTGTYTPTQTGRALVGPSEAIGFDAGGEGVATAWDSVAVNVVSPPCGVAIGPLDPDPNPYFLGNPVSTVMLGGTAIRHYQVRARVPGNVSIAYTVNGQPRTATTDQQGHIVHEVGEGEVAKGLPIDTSGFTAAGVYEVKFEAVNGSPSVCSQPFFVEVTPREYTRGYTAGASIDAAATLGVGLSGKAGSGLGFSIEHAGTNTTRLSIERSISAGLGLQVGISLPKARFALPGVRGQVGASTEATAMGTLAMGDTHEFQYAADSTQLSQPQSVALGGLIISVLAATQMNSPLIAAILELIADTANYDTYLTTDSISLGLEGIAEGDAGAIVGLGFKDKQKNQVFSTMRYGLGIGGSITGTRSATISVDLNHTDLELSPGFDVKQQLDLSGFVGAGSVKFKLDTDHGRKDKVLSLQDKFKATLRGTRAEGINARLSLDATDDYRIKKLMVTLSSAKGFGWQVAGQGYQPVSGTGEGKNSITYIFTDRTAILKVFDRLLSIQQLGLAAGAGSGGAGAVFAEALLQEEILELWHILAESDATFESSTDDGNGIALPIELDLGAGARVKLGVSIAFDRAISFVTSRGVVKDGGSYELERYTPDVHIPVVPDATDLSDLAGIVGEAGRGLVNATVHAANRAVDVVSRLVTLGMNLIRSNATAQLVFDGATANFPEIAIASFVYTAIPGPVAAGVQRPADVAGPAGVPHYGIGGFHQFAPIDAELSAPGTLTIEYRDAEVAGLDESALGIYVWNPAVENWDYVGGTVDATANTITTQVRRLGLYTAAPPMPGSPFTFSSLTAAAGTPEEPRVRVTYTSSVIRLNTGQVVPDGTLFTIRSLWPGSSDPVAFGTVLTADADPLADGIQVTSANGVIQFVAEYPGAFGAARILANAVRGVAIGDQVIAYQ
jgi:hypothetical protein